MLDMILRWLSDLSTADLDKLDIAVELERARRDVCEHGIVCGKWCPDCHAEYHRARVEHYGADTA